MPDEPTIDKGTGLLNRQGFLQKVRNSQSKLSAKTRRGCLLIFRFPILLTLPEKPGDEVVNDALSHLLAIMETRLRSRDLLGRIARNSLCLMLKQCSETNAVIVADQYVALMKDVAIDLGGKPSALELHYQIVPLDDLGARPKQGITRLVAATELPLGTAFVKELHVSTNYVDFSQSKVVSLSDARQIQRASEPEIARVTRLSSVTSAADEPIGSWRLRPGLLIKRKPLSCCFRMQQMGMRDTPVLLRDSDVFASVLNALALQDQDKRPRIESQIILPVQSAQIDPEFATWVNNRCETMRVAPSDICLSLSVESLSHNLRVIAPTLRMLNRRGIRLMLEGVESAASFDAMSKLARFDYLYISGRVLNDSFKQHRMRLVLESLVYAANRQDCEICSGGVDSQALTEHALKVGVEIGFGRDCGKSIPFPELS